MRSRSAVLGLSLLTLPAGATASSLYGLVDTGEVFASTDQGATWAAGAPLPVRDAVGLWANSISELLLVSRSGGVFVAFGIDGPWFAGIGPPAGDVVAVEVIGSEFYLVTETGSVWVSGDFSSWTQPGVIPTSDASGLTWSPVSGLFACSSTGEIYRSEDDGATWSITGTLPISDAVAVRAAGPSLFVMTATGDLWQSPDDGVAWTLTGTLSHVGVTDLLLHDGEFVAVTREGHAARSADGATWTWQGTIDQLTVVALGTDAQPTGVNRFDLPPPRIRLSSPFPNPLVGRGGSSFRFTLDRAMSVRLVLHDVRGRVVTRRPSQSFAGEGTYTIHWDPGDLPAGVYYVRLEGGGTTAGTSWTMLR